LSAFDADALDDFCVSWPR